MVSEEAKIPVKNEPLEKSRFAVSPPGPLDVADPRKLAENWRIWRQDYDDFMILSGLARETSELQLAMFRHALGQPARGILNSLTFAPSDNSKDPAVVMTTFEKYCLAQENETYERFKFFTRDRQAGETIDQYVAALKELAESCKFCDCMKTSLIKDRIVLGVNEESITRRLLKCRQLNLQQCVSICRSEESADLQFKRLSVENDESQLHAIRPSNAISCNFCGLRHERRKEKCPAWGKTCNKCRKQNHFASKCRSYPVKSVESEEAEEFCLNGVENTSRKNALWAEVIIEGTKRRFQLDTGASVNLIPESFVRRTSVKPTNCTLKMWNGTTVQPVGEAELRIMNPRTQEEFDLIFIVAGDNTCPILGLSAVEQMHLITVQRSNFLGSVDCSSIIENYTRVFDSELGCLPGDVNLSLLYGCVPVALPVRGIPFALREAVRAELERLVSLNVIAKVDEPTDWVSQIAIVQKKSGAIRLCIDPKPLNLVLRREYFRIPTLEDMLPSLSGATFFTKVDLSSAFWQLKLNEESSYLTTFGTPFGRFRWLRLPFGLKVSSEIFQKRLMQALDRLDGTICIADDVLIFGRTSAEHDENLNKFFARCEDQGIKLSRDKVEYRVSAVTFHGHVLTASGLKADPEKVKAIESMPAPEDPKAVARLNGMVNYLSRFLPHLAEVMEPIRRLTHKGVEWEWGEQQKQAFETIKATVTKSPVLAYYNPDLPLVVQCDSSQYGLGAVLLQKGRPLDYRSRNLTAAERNYAQIEKELLAVVYAMERFNTYTFGRKVVVLTDHKPLVNIVKKSLNEVPKRLQRMLIRLQKYDYDLSYQPGEQMFIADTLSRAYLQEEDAPTYDFDVVAAVDDDAVSELDAQIIQQTIQQDAQMQDLMKLIRDGWPLDKRMLPDHLKIFHKDRDHLAIDGVFIVKGDRLLIPTGLRPTILRHLHAAHAGVNSTIRRARELYFWPSMTSQIKDYVTKCQVCRQHDPKQTKEPMLSRQLPIRPWQLIGVDLFTHAGKQYLVMADYYSDFLGGPAYPDNFLGDSEPHASSIRQTRDPRNGFF